MNLSALAALSRAEIEEQLGTSACGLSSVVAAQRVLAAKRPYSPRGDRRKSLGLPAHAAEKSLALLLLFAAIASGPAGSWLDAGAARELQPERT